MSSVSKFIIESNRINTEYDLSGILIPGEKPGDILYDNSMDAWNTALEFLRRSPIDKRLFRAIHREITKGVDSFEQFGLSGMYRKVDTKLAGDWAPPVQLVPVLIEETLCGKIEEFTRYQQSKRQAQQNAWWLHDFFQCVVPFSGCNGLVGRMAMAAFLEFSNFEPIVIDFKDKEKYYKKTLGFRDRVFFNQYHPKHTEPVPPSLMAE